jgi:hypothetical protein
MRLLAGILLGVMAACSQSTPQFTAVEVSRRFDAGGNLKSESRFLIAVNREGSLASVDLDPSAGSTRQVIDVAKHRTLVVDPNSRRASVMPFGNSPFRKSQRNDACDQRFQFMQDAIVSVNKSFKMMSGVSVDRISVNLPNGLSMEFVVAPSLQCHVLESTVRQGGAVTATQTVEDFQRRDPDPALFAVPAGYHITTVEVPAR